jgi:hypothetical protein
MALPSQLADPPHQQWMLRAHAVQVASCDDELFEACEASCVGVSKQEGGLKTELGMQTRQCRYSAGSEGLQMKVSDVYHKRGELHYSATSSHATRISWKRAPD